MLFWLSVFALSTLLVMCKLYAYSILEHEANNHTSLFLSEFITVMFRYRATLISHVPNPIKSLFPSLGHYTPLSTFEDQANAGLTSSNFDIEANIRDGDSRAGLDERSTQEILAIMRRDRVKCVHLLIIHHCFPSPQNKL